MGSVRSEEAGATASERRGLAGILGQMIRSPVTAAVCLTLLDAVKPLHIDDTAYYRYAEHIAADPLHPYAFEILWGQGPLPAMDVLAPPVLPCWWALAIRLFGDRPWLWKLWLFPLSLILTASLRAIGRRFARGLETYLVWLIVVSPAILPGLNLMLDVPALALNLGALAIFIRAVDRGSAVTAMVAGLVGGLAAQTKYTGLSAPAAILAYAVLHGQVRLGLIAAMAAASVFISCEGWIALIHGRSHLLNHVGRRSASVVERGRLAIVLPSLIGALAPAATALGMVGLGLSRRWLALLGAVVSGGLSLLGIAPKWVDDVVSKWLWPGLGVLAFAVAAAAAMRLTGVIGGNRGTRDRRSVRRSDGFLVIWLGLELASYIALTPYAAARRVLGIIVVMTILAGRLVIRARRPGRPALLTGVLIGGMALGGFYTVVDIGEALSHEVGVEEAARWIRRREPGATIWYLGHWGFQFYADRAGLKPVIPGESRLRAGDWLVIADDRVDRPTIHLAPGDVEPVHILGRWPRLGYRTWSYYSGSVPIHGDHELQISVRIERAARDFIPAGPPLAPGSRDGPASPGGPAARADGRPADEAHG